jgi:two-component sensor histidine kinase/ABC-type amino acid transport substrate-binding protein
MAGPAPEPDFAGALPVAVLQGGGLKPKRAWMLILGLALVLAACANRGRNEAVFRLPLGTVDPKRLVVVCDNNYPPYAFSGANGNLEGIVPDSWAAWSKATGIEVELRGLPWAEAIATFDSNRADVLDTVFRTPARELRYDFTRPYANLEVPVFIHKTISGIASVGDLRGFRVAAKEGDAAVDSLKQGGVADIVTYPSYEAIVRAAAAHEVRIFSIDKPPALYLLYKFGIDTDFRIAFKLGEGAFHRAVKKGNTNLLGIIEEGFSAVPAADVAAIQLRWLGSDISRTVNTRLIGTVVAIALLAVVALLGLAWTLRRRVSRATLELREKVALLEESEARNKASIAEKEVLLKEVHHRVKNNMQVISSLIQLQSYGIRDEGDRELLRETQERIRAMAQLHELLYRSRDLSSIDAGEYIGAVVSELALGHDFVGLDCKFDSARLGLDASVPLGLIANELVINAIKYAYPGRDQGPVEVAFRTEGAEVVLRVRDEGRGLPAGVDPLNCSSMGLTLVRSLATQLKGKLIFSGPPGFGIEFRFAPF